MSDVPTHAPLPRADQLIVDRAQEDFEEGLQWIRERLRQPGRGSAFMARAMEVGVMGAVSTLQLRPRYRDDVVFLLALAHRVNAGEAPAALAQENLPRALRVRELSLVARVKEPDFQRVLDLALGIFETRLPDLGRMVAVEDPVDYPDLVRRAFPDEAYVLAFIDENRRTMIEMVDHFEKHPALLRVPDSWVPTLCAMGRDMVEWESARVGASVRAMYAV